MERIARILSHLAFPVCQCVSSPPGVPWSFLRPDPPASPCSFQLLLPAAPLLLFFRTVSPVCLPARCRLSVCLGIECIAFNIYLLLFSLFTHCRAHFSFSFPAREGWGGIENSSAAVRWKRKIKNAIAIKIAWQTRVAFAKSVAKGVCMFSAHEYPLPSSINSCIHNGRLPQLYICMYVCT